MPSPAIDDHNESLLRQVHPNFVRDGRVSSAAFKPSKKDDKMLSVARSSLATPESAFRHHTETLSLQSAGTWSVTVGECDAVGLNAMSDPLEGPPPDPAHAFIDFRACSSNGQIEARAIQLTRLANERGRLFPTA